MTASVNRKQIQRKGTAWTNRIPLVFLWLLGGELEKNLKCRKDQEARKKTERIRAVKNQDAITAVGVDAKT